jgi:hypothetical protein
LTASVEVSLTDRPRLTRPFPVWSAVPAASALRASRPTITPGPAESSAAASRPADPATIAAAADVPVTEVVPPPACVVTIPTPGAARNVSAPKFDDDASSSDSVVDETPTTPSEPAGKVAVEDPSFPVAATSTAPLDQSVVQRAPAEPRSSPGSRKTSG